MTQIYFLAGDASIYETGAVISHYFVDGSEGPITCTSHKWSSAVKTTHK